MIKSVLVHRIAQLMKDGKTADEIFETLQPECQAKGQVLCRHYVDTSMRLVGLGLTQQNETEETTDAVESND